MDKLKIYMDNCCYNRPFDDMTQQERFDYTEWRHDNLFEDMTIEELVSNAAEFERQHPESVPKNARVI